jgi:hypothetical protein
MYVVGRSVAFSGSRPALGVDGAVAEGRNPYRGLEMFDVEYAALFFDREALTV